MAQLKLNAREHAPGNDDRAEKGDIPAWNAWAIIPGMNNIILNMNSIWILLKTKAVLFHATAPFHSRDSISESAKVINASENSHFGKYLNFLFLAEAARFIISTSTVGKRHHGAQLPSRRSIGASWIRLLPLSRDLDGHLRDLGWLKRLMNMA